MIVRAHCFVVYVGIISSAPGVTGWASRSKYTHRCRCLSRVASLELSRADFLSSATALSLAALNADDRQGGPAPVFPVSRAEVTSKLQRVPMFFVSAENGGIALNSLGQGQFFFEKQDADEAGIMLRPDRVAGSCT